MRQVGRLIEAAALERYAAQQRQRGQRGGQLLAGHAPGSQFQLLQLRESPASGAGRTSSDPVTTSVARQHLSRQQGLAGSRQKPSRPWHTPAAHPNEPLSPCHLVDGSASRSCFRASCSRQRQSGSSVSRTGKQPPDSCSLQHEGRAGGWWQACCWLLQRRHAAAAACRRRGAAAHGAGTHRRRPGKACAASSVSARSSLLPASPGSSENPVSSSWTT